MIVLFLTALPTLWAYNSLYMQYYFETFLVLCFSEPIFSFLIKMLMVTVKEIETAFCHSLGNPKGHTFDYFYCA